MPQLKSGRHVALSASPYLKALASGPDESRYFAVVALRLNAPTPDALVKHLVIGHYLDGTGTPPNAPCYNSGYCVADILEGRSDWSPDEVDEFRNFITQDPRFKTWLQAQFDELNHAIEVNPLWESDLMQTSDGIDVRAIKRAIILKSAAEPGVMAQLRASK
jgi:hypothetical protein